MPDRSLDTEDSDCSKLWVQPGSMVLIYRANNVIGNQALRTPPAKAACGTDPCCLLATKNHNRARCTTLNLARARLLDYSVQTLKEII